MGESRLFTEKDRSTGAPAQAPTRQAANTEEIIVRTLTIHS